MSDQETKDKVIQDISERVQASLKDDIVTKESVQDIVTRTVRENIDALLDDEEFARKMRFGGGDSAPELTGSKFSRWGLTLPDIEFLYDIQSALRGQRKVNGGGVYEGPSEELENAFNHISRAFYLPQDKIREIDKKALDNVFPRAPLSAFTLKDQILIKQGRYQETSAYQRATRAMDTAESGFGSELVGAQYVGELWEGARAESRVFALLETFEMTDPTAYLPVEADIPELLFVSESTGSGSSNYTTSKTGSNRVQVDAKKFVIHQMWSGEMEEDSIIAFVPFLRRQALLSLAHYSDSLVLNGDTTNAATGNINLDDADPADTKHYLAFDGIRHVGLVDNTGNENNLGAALTLAALSEARGLMLDTTYLFDWGHPTNADDLIYVADPETADKVGQLDEVVVWRQNQARQLLAGQVAEVLGHPVISSIAMSKTEADGKVSTTAANNTLGQVVAFNRRGFVPGWRRRVRTEVERLPATDQTRIVYSMRMGFGRYSPTGAAAGIEAAAVIRNISL